MRNGRGMQHTWEKKRSNTIVVENSGGREEFGRPKPKWSDNIKLEPKEIEGFELGLSP